MGVSPVLLLPRLLLSRAGAIEPLNDHASLLAKSMPLLSSNIAFESASSSIGNAVVPSDAHLPFVGNGKCDRGQFFARSMEITPFTCFSTTFSAFKHASILPSIPDLVTAEATTVGTPTTAALRAALTALDPCIS